MNEMFIFICGFSAKVTCAILEETDRNKHCFSPKHYQLSSTFLIRGFQGYRCKSGIAIFACIGSQMKLFVIAIKKEQRN